jgi:hypothetical protein
MQTKSDQIRPEIAIRGAKRKEKEKEGREEGRRKNSSLPGRKNIP